MHRHRIETSFAKHDLEGKGTVSKDQIGQIMEDLGHRYVVRTSDVTVRYCSGGWHSAATKHVL